MSSSSVVPPVVKAFGMSNLRRAANTRRELEKKIAKLQNTRIERMDKNEVKKIVNHIKKYIKLDSKQTNNLNTFTRAYLKPGKNIIRKLRNRFIQIYSQPKSAKSRKVRTTVYKDKNYNFNTGQKITSDIKRSIEHVQEEAISKNHIETMMNKYSERGAFNDYKTFIRFWRQDNNFQDMISLLWGDIMWDRRSNGVAINSRQKKTLEKDFENKCDINPEIDIPVSTDNHEHGADNKGVKCCSLFKNGFVAHRIGTGIIEGSSRMCGYGFKSDVKKNKTFSGGTRKNRISNNKTRKLRR
jgi:hypothetical protein